MARTSTTASSLIVSPALSTFCWLTKTTPAMIRALARSRLCTRPFCTEDIDPTEFSQLVFSFREGRPDCLHKIRSVQTGALLDLRNSRVRQPMLFAALKLAHVLAVVVWIGGMVFAHFFLRPAVLKLEPPQRIRLMRSASSPPCSFLSW